jgi:crossover junction endodeoxyribonuclease RusA
MTITLSLPPAALSPNARVHWGKKHRAAKAYRNTARWLAWSASQDRDDFPWPRARVTCRFYFRVNRKRDGDNLLASMKPAFDGIAAAGVVKDDSAFVHMPAEIIINRQGKPHVEITIEPEVERGERDAEGNPDRKDLPRPERPDQAP